MSKFHESVRELLEDVQQFLTILNKETLSMETLSRKESLLTKLNALQQDYPQLNSNVLSKSLSPNQFGSNGDKEILVLPNPPSSPPPYVDMQGNKNTSGSNEPPDEDYEVCNNDKSYLSKEYLPENKSLNDSEEAPMEEESPAVLASDLTKSEKCGYLGKKGKERLGGLLNPFQRRWCAIKDGILYYFERPTDKRQKGEIPLAGYEIRLAPNATKDVNKRNLCFELTCPGKKTYQFMASTPKDVKQWVAAVERNNKISPDGSIDSDEDNIYEMVDETGNQTKLPTKELDDSENEPLYVEGESCDQNDLYTDAESTTKEEWENFNPQDWYVGLWDCKGDDKNELDFSRGDLIHIVSKEYDSCAWWVGYLKGKIGLVPKSYLMEAYEVI